MSGVEQLKLSMINLLSSNDKKSFDLKIKPGKGSDIKKSFLCHKNVIKIRCPELYKLHKKNTITIKNCPSVLEDFIYFLYCGNLPKSMNIEKAMLLSKMASKWSLPFLSYLCEDYVISEEMTLTNAKLFQVLAMSNSIKYQNVHIKKLCLSFAVKNYNEFMTNKDGIYILGIELFQEVVKCFQTKEFNNYARSPICIDPYVDDFKQSIYMSQFKAKSGYN